MADLNKDNKSVLKSQTVQGNILSIIGALGGLFAIIHGGAPIDILVPAITAGGAAIWGNIMSILGRYKATRTLGPVIKK